MVTRTEANSYIELTIFDDDGPEGFYKKEYFMSSWEAIVHAVLNYTQHYNFTITQINTGKRFDD